MAFQVGKCFGTFKKWAPGELLNEKDVIFTSEKITVAMVT